MVMLVGAILAAYRTSNRCRMAGEINDALIGICMVVSMIGFMIHCMFGAFLGNEWGFWLVALLLRYSELYDPALQAARASDVDPVAA